MSFADALLDGSHFLRRQWILVLAAALLGAGLAGVIGWLLAPPPEFRATAVVRFPTGPVALTTDPSASESATYLGLVSSLAVAEEAARRLNMLPALGDPELRKAAPYMSVVHKVQQRIRAEVVPGGIAVTVSADRPDLAAQAATVVAEQSMIERKRWGERQWVSAKRIFEAQLVAAEHRLREAEQDLREFREREGPVLYAEEAKAAFDAILWLEREQDELARGKAEAIRSEQTAKVRGIQAQEAVLAKQLTKARERYARLPKVSAELARLERAIKIEGDTFEGLKSHVERQVLIGARFQNEQVDIEPAAAPAAPVVPLCLQRWFIGGGLIGLLLGAMGGFWREASATSLRAIDGLQTALKVPVLGVLPRYRARALQGQVAEQYAKGLTPEGLDVVAHLFSVGAPDSAQAEGIRSVQANLEFAVGDAPMKVLTVTSAGSTEGKTLMAVNLAVALAHEGRRVLLVDADVRHPRVHDRLGLSRDPGLADVLGGSVPWRAAVQSVADLMLGPLGVDPVMRTPRLDNLSVLPAGSLPVAPHAFPAAKLALLLKEMREDYDLVLVDAPAILPVLDAVRVSAKADGTILVYQGGRGGYPALKRSKFLLDHARAKILGLVLTNVGPESLLKPAANGYYGK